MYSGIPATRDGAAVLPLPGFPLERAVVPPENLWVRWGVWHAGALPGETLTIRPELTSTSSLSLGPGMHLELEVALSRGSTNREAPLITDSGAAKKKSVSYSPLSYELCVPNVHH